MANRPSRKPQKKGPTFLDKFIMDNGMPHNPTAQKGLLSCFFHNPELLNQTVPIEYFYPCFKDKELHGDALIFSELKSMWDKEGFVEYMAFSGLAQKKGIIGKMGGPGGLSELLDFVPTAAHFGWYLSQLKDAHLARLCVASGVEMVDMGYTHQDDPDALSQLCESRLYDIQNAAHLGAKQESWSDEIDTFEKDWSDAYHGKKRSSVPSRWPEWNRVLGGITPEFYVVKGKTSRGKTSLALNILRTVGVDRKEPCLWFPYEMRKSSLIARLIADMAEVDSRCLFAPDVFKPSREERNRISEAKEKLAEAPIQLVKERHMDASFIGRKAKEFRSKHGGVALIGIDYLQKIDHPEWSGRTDNASERLAYNNDYCFKIQQDMGCTMLMISSTNNEGGTLGSQGADYDCDIALEVDREKGVAIKKNRNGGGVGETIPLTFNGDYVRFESREEEPSDMPS